MSEHLSVPTLEAPSAIFSLGHSNQPLDRLLNLLHTHGIRALVDVRSQPVSQYSPHFNHAPLKDAVEEAGLEYVFAGDTLGGRPNGPQFYDRAGHVLYYMVADADFFRDGISRLAFLAEERGPVAIMCSEEDPTNCHRRLLIGRVLGDEGYQLLHIRGNGRVQMEAELPGGRKVSSRLQTGFFDRAEESAWKSTRSVLPARPQSAFSRH